MYINIYIYIYIYSIKADAYYFQNKVDGKRKLLVNTIDLLPFFYKLQVISCQSRSKIGGDA